MFGDVCFKALERGLRLGIVRALATDEAMHVVDFSRQARLQFRFLHARRQALVSRIRRGSTEADPALDETKCARDQQERCPQQAVRRVARQIEKDDATGQKGEMRPVGKPRLQRFHHAATDGVR